MKISALKTVAIAVAASAAAYIVYKVAAGGQTVASAASSAAAAVNPANPNNLAARAANAITQSATGDPSTSFGSFLFDLFNPTQSATDNLITSPSIPTGRGDPSGWSAFNVKAPSPLLTGLPGGGNYYWTDPSYVANTQSTATPIASAPVTIYEYGGLQGAILP